ncbi:MAG TPA: hypothetical protein VHQ47_12615 [Phycisphaerae bacterium]|nr:hypothetical protein [Phycisphaerae bacterium]
MSNDAKRFGRAMLVMMCGAAVTWGGCQSAGQQTVGVSAPTAEQMRVKAALAQWPPEAPAGSLTGVKRTFFCTIRILGQRTTASGVLSYYGPRDFRITAVTELGVILFDARMNWAGVTVLREMPGLPVSSVEALVGDLSAVFHLPENLNGLSPAGGDRLILKRTEADTHKYTWTFDAASGRLKQIDVDMGAFDTLHVQIKGYDGRGWPMELVISRKARFYTVNLSFTDDPVVRRDGGAGGSMRVGP